MPPDATREPANPVITWPDLCPRYGDRAVIVGHTGCGKSYLAERMLGLLNRDKVVVIIDVKGRFKYPCEAYINDPLTQLSKVRARSVMYRPHLDSDIHLDARVILRSCFKRGGVVIYIDDVTGLADKNENYPPDLMPVYTMGRELDVTVIASMQRPARVPLYMISETDQQYVFRLNMPEDRKRMATMVGDRAMTPPTEIEEYGFWYNCMGRNIAPDRPLKLR